jgi:N-methylhydantoinase A/oxoprolinase/acetone carboxylase beta subunit
MKPHLTIGIDIGGTFTDAVAVDASQRIVGFHKTLTTPQLEEGFKLVLDQLIQETGLNPGAVQTIHVGTTHATNAVLQAKDLCKVGLIRIAGHQPDTIPPCYTWPADVRSAVLHAYATIDGGFECDGRTITPLDLSQARAAIEQLLTQGVESIAVCGVFSPLNAEHELAIAELAHNRVPISLSHRIGGIGFMERENATVLNACLKKIMGSGLAKLADSAKRLKFTCPLQITQNDGSVIALQEAVDYPILTISAGQTNSFIGGMRLTGLKDCIVVDIGGTSADVGLIKNGIPKRSIESCSIGGITLNFPMPDVLSIALGGGSHVHSHGIGPASSARRLMQEAQSFGGNQLTLTDMALKLGHLSIPGARIERIQASQEYAQQVMDTALHQLRTLVDQVTPYRQPLPVILVGGGASLFNLQACERYLVPQYFQVANAYGAALAQVAMKTDVVVSLDQREAVMADIKAQAKQGAIARGACPKRVDIVDLQIIPYHYMPGNKARVIAVAAGPKA